MSLTVAAALVIAVVVFVEGAGSQLPGTPAPPISRAAIVEQNREADALVSQDQAPRVATLKAGVAPAGGATAAVTAAITRELRAGAITGRLQGSSCTLTATASAARRAFRCRVEVGNVYYPFDAVVVGRTVTYCKRDYPPVPSMNIPVSARCT